MSIVPKLARRSLKIVALPLTTTPRTPGASSCGHLTYYHFFTPPPENENKRGPVKWVTTKTLDLWAGFGTAPEGSWKVYTSYDVPLGERVLWVRRLTNTFSAEHIYTVNAS